VLFGECHKADAIDGPKVAGREIEAYEPIEFRDPDTTTLDVDELPSFGLDVGVRNVVCEHPAFTGDLAPCHDCESSWVGRCPVQFQEAAP